MTFLNDLSVNTLLMTLLVGGAGLVIKAASWAIVGACKTLITQLIETMAEVKALKASLEEIKNTVADHPKLRDDLGKAFARLKVLETKNET